MGFFGFVMAGGGTVGVLLGGVLTDALNWHWIFLVNLPIGVAVFLAGVRFLPGSATQAKGRLDVAGAALVTAALMLAVYAVVNGNADGWTSTSTLGRFAASVVLFAAFVALEKRVREPLVPLGLFRLRNLTTANVVGVLWSAAMFAWFFIAALYLQLVLGYDPLQVGLAFLPATLIMATFSISLSAKLVTRFGFRSPLTVGMVLVAAGLAYFAQAPVDGSYWSDVFPAMVLTGIGVGLAFNPVLLAAMSDAKPSDSGLASGVANTSFMMGGALGLAALASLAAARTNTLTTLGSEPLVALNSGYQFAFAAGAVAALIAAFVGGLFLRANAGEAVQDEARPSMAA